MLLCCLACKREYIERDLSRWQKRPIKVAKETPIKMAKETYIHFKRDFQNDTSRLHTQDKNSWICNTDLKVLFRNPDHSESGI